tara:strand:- start:189 stop:512 length:324 start_codon:yes stop_codon:yes gene_type:complete
MSKAPLSFNFREDLTSLDYQKIIVEQNDAIIKLLALQQDSILKGGLNRVVQDNYAKAIKPFLVKQEDYNLSDRKKALLKTLRIRNDNGENIYALAKELGLEDFFTEE